MTLLAVLSDLHGNLPALEAVLADLAPLGVDQVIVAGDVINWGPHSAEVMARVVAAGWPVIRGNNEFYLLDYATPRAPAGWQAHDQWPLLPWLKQQLAGRWQTVIAGWPDTLSLRFPDAPPLRVVHGTLSDNTEPMMPGASDGAVAAQLAGIEAGTVIAGHTHLLMDRRVPGWPAGGAWHVINPGSVGNPLDGCPASRYMLLEGTPSGWAATPRAVPLDPEPVLRKFERQDFAARCGVVGQLVMREYRTSRIELHPFLTWRGTHGPQRPFSPELLAEYDQLADPLPYVLEGYREGWLRSQAAQAKG